MPKNKSPKNSETDSSSTDELAPDFPSRIVGIGASAGGLEALELFFDNMPINSGMAFVVVQHLSPDHPSMMNDLLSKRTKMVVQMASNDLDMKANHVYLIPPSTYLTIFHNKLIVVSFVRDGSLNLPVDILFNSLVRVLKVTKMSYR